MNIQKILFFFACLSAYSTQIFAADHCDNKFLNILFCKYKYHAIIAPALALTGLTFDAGIKASLATSSSACIGCSVASGVFGSTSILAVSFPIYCAYKDYTEECERQRAREQALRLQQIRMAINHAATGVTIINPIYNTYLGEALPTQSDSPYLR